MNYNSFLQNNAVASPNQKQQAAAAMAAANSNPNPSTFSFYKWDISLLKQIRLFVQLRLELISQYKQLSQVADPPVYVKYCDFIFRIRHKYVPLLDHPFLALRFLSR